MTKPVNEDKPKTLPVRLLQGYWPEDGSGKLLDGSIVELPADEARKAVKLGFAERADSF